MTLEVDGVTIVNFSGHSNEDVQPPDWQPKKPEPKDFPQELLLIILRYALPPTWQLHGERAVLPSPKFLSYYDMEMKFSILTLPIRALEGREGLGPLVKQLELVIPRGYTALLQNDAQKIFELCPRLLRFGFAPLHIPGLAYTLPAMGPTITCLDFGENVALHDLMSPLVQLCRNLLSLSLTFTASYDENDPELNFDSLQDFRLRLAVYGATITFISWNHGLQDARYILAKCPALENLVMTRPVQGWGHYSNGISHKKIRTIDIWRTWPWFEPWPRFDPWSRFPALPRLRDLDRTFIHFGDLPVRVPLLEFKKPDVMGVVREFSQLESAHGRLMGLDSTSGDYEDESDWRSDSGSDTNSDSDMDANADSTSDSTLGRELEDEFYMAEEWQITHDEALTIISGTP
ncbi:hypothetical protein C8R47DRAFT_1190327 [Mycena vitilis]|nr:hypothetical protein C8R47DRAFT_1190327 [Mycena vitilis]